MVPAELVSRLENLPLYRSEGNPRFVSLQRIAAVTVDGRLVCFET